MIVTRSWLETYIDLDGISDQELYEAFNRIGLEVDNMRKYDIPSGIKIGRIVACGRHPDADKLSLCQIDVGDGDTKQIICGAANVVDAEYVAVATIGSVLPDGLKIKKAKLRGVESYGMVCSSEELGLPKINDGIMILDDSIGELEVGRELGTYPMVADTVIELELTANRGDCLSIHGVARDLSAAFDRPLKKIKPNTPAAHKGGIARKLAIHAAREIDADMIYLLADNDGLSDRVAVRLRLGFAGMEPRTILANFIKYTMHTTGVVLHAYDTNRLKDEAGKITLNVRREDNYTVVEHDNQTISRIGIDFDQEYSAHDGTDCILFEASYINPDTVVRAVALNNLKTDDFYYNTSRGSEPNLHLGVSHLKHICSDIGECHFYDGDIPIYTTQDKRVVNASVQKISAIIGDEISKKTIYAYLERLGFEIHTGQGDTFGIHVPPHRHDIVNLQDIAEEVLRIKGIDNIAAKPLDVSESNRLTVSTRLYKQKRDIRQRAVAAGFFEAVTYAFAERKSLEAYGFDTIDADLDLLNPIVEELNTLRTTLLINLLDAAKRNVSYGIKAIPLFEIGAVFGSQREQTDKIAFVWSGQVSSENISNQGKPSSIDLAVFVDRISRVTGEFALRECSATNALVHPYQSADIIKRDQRIGYITKLHPAVAEQYGLGDTYLAELDLVSVLPRHIDAQPISNYQGAYKDISVLVDRALPYASVSDAISSARIRLLKKHFLIDVYENESLGERKSVTVRLFVQSDEDSLTDVDIDNCVSSVLDVLHASCGAVLR